MQCGKLVVTILLESTYRYVEWKKISWLAYVLRTRFSTTLEFTLERTLAIDSWKSRNFDTLVYTKRTVIYVTKHFFNLNAINEYGYNTALLALLSSTISHPDFSMSSVSARSEWTSFWVLSCRNLCCSSSVRFTKSFHTWNMHKLHEQKFKSLLSTVHWNVIYWICLHCGNWCEHSTSSNDIQFRKSQGYGQLINYHKNIHGKQTIHPYNMGWPHQSTLHIKCYGRTDGHRVKLYASHVEGIQLRFLVTKVQANTTINSVN